jgi:hypothetical protein
LLFFLSIFLLFPQIWDLGFTLLFSDPEGMQVFRVDRCVRSEASIVGINWRYWGVQFGRGGSIENAAERGAVPIMPNAPNAEPVEVKGELKKINKQLRQLIELKTQANLMAGCFFCCIIVIEFLSLLIRR